MRSKLARLTLVGSAVAAALAISAIAFADNAPPLMMAHTGAKLTVLGPVAGTTVTANSVATNVAIKSFGLNCALAGTAPKAHVGHYHVELDHSLINMFCGPKATISMLDVAAGKHTLAFIPAADDHAEDMHAAKTVSFLYKPSKPLPAAKPLQFAGKPSISIVSPKPGVTVHRSFDLVIDVKNFRLSCDLYGKANVAGYGHWHINLDTTSKGMMGMGTTMMGMSCQRSFHVSLAGIKGAGTHKFFAILEDNTHAPTIGAQASVSVNVK